MMLYTLIEVFGGFFWLLIVVGVVVLIARSISRKPSANNVANSGQYNDYQLGYIDGFNEYVKQVRQQLADGQPIDKAFIEKLEATYTPVEADEVQANIELTEDQASEGIISAEIVEEKPAVVSEAAPTSILTTPVGEALLPKGLTAEQKSMRVLNILLSLGSLLFIAAGIAFIASGFSDMVKLVGIMVIISMFYVGGLVLHKFYEKIRPASVAFIGAGLALVPFFGIALSSYTSMSGKTAWLITSIIGIVAYYLATMRLRSQVVSYLTVAFVLSFTSSMVANVGLPVFWYFISFILFSLLASVIAQLKPSWIPDIFAAPIEQAGNILTPLSLVASLLFAGRFKLLDYEIIFGVATLHYLVSWFQTKSYTFEQVVRGLAHITLLLVIKDITNDNWVNFGIGFLILAAIQQVYSLIRQLDIDKSSEKMYVEHGWLWGMFGMQLFSLIFWASSLNISGLTSISFSVMLAMSVLTVLVTKRAMFAYPGLAASLILPSLVGYEVMEPAWPSALISSIYILLSLGALIAYKYWRKTWGETQIFITLAAVIHLLAAVLTTMRIENDLLGALFAVILAAVVITMSHIYAVGYLVAAAGPLLLVVSGRLAASVNLSNGDALVTMFGGAALLAYGITVIYYLLGDRRRRLSMLAVGHALVIPFALSTASDTFTRLDQQTMQRVAVVILAAWSLLTLLARRKFTEGAPRLKAMFDVFYILYYTVALALVLGLGFPNGWLTVLLALGVFYAWELSYAEKQPHLGIMGNILSLWLVYDLLRIVDVRAEWRAVVTAWVVALLFYGAYWYFKSVVDKNRQDIMLWSVWVVVGFGFLLNVWPESTRIASALLLMFGAATVAWDGQMRGNRDEIEASCYVGTLSLSIIINRIAPELNAVFYAHLFAAAVALMGYWRKQDHTRYIIAMAMLTWVGGLFALTKGGSYSLLFLVEHVLLLLAGALFGRMWAVWWGIIASVLAIFYYLKDIPFLAFTLLGLVVIGFVIWRLTRTNVHK